MASPAPVAPVTVDEIRQCLQQPSQIIETNAGPVEYAIRGEGPVLLSVHGGPGGYDQGLVLGECFRKNGFQVIAVSRPGYLRTPLLTGETLEEQADALKAFIEAMGLCAPAVLGASAGGPASYLLAQRHGEHVGALIEIDSVSMTYTKVDELSKVDEFFYLSKPGLWVMDFLLKHFPAPMVKGFLQSESSLEEHEMGERVQQIVSDPQKLAFLQAVVRTMTSEYDRRKEGVDNDVARMRALDKLPLDKVACPTLIMHGNADGDVPPRDAQYAHEAISGSELYWVERGSHIGFWIADTAEAAQQHAVQWLREKMGA